jgi:RimJ/RimL family protein N-acetyltransferase
VDVIHPQNVASIRVAEKIGMEIELHANAMRHWQPCALLSAQYCLQCRIERRHIKGAKT